MRINLRLIPGVQVADRVFALIDVDGDGQISPVEEQAYAQRVRRDLAREVDGRRASLVLTEVHFPSQREMSEGIGAIRLGLTTEAPTGTAGEHQISFRNDHLPELGVYLANALVPPTDAIKITGQQRDSLQHELRVNFGVRSVDAPAGLHWTGGLLVVIWLALLLKQWKCLYNFLLRLKGGQINAKKTYS